MRVYVYRNLTDRCWSLINLEGPAKGRVSHCDTAIVLRDCKFKVRASGRRKVRREKCKNVHAGIEGTIVEGNAGTSFPTEVTYDPYRFRTFVFVDGERPIYKAPFVLMDDQMKVWVPPISRPQA